MRVWRVFGGVVTCGLVLVSLYALSSDYSSMHISKYSLEYEAFLMIHY